MIVFRNIDSSLSYGEILAIQREEFNKRIQLRKQNKPLPDDVVLMVEHKPVYTLGLHGREENLLLSPVSLAFRGAEFVKTDRGGDITYHGPGQITVYPILDLLRYHLGVKDYVNLLEETVIRTIARYGIKGERIPGRTGVWIGKSTPDERKISAIGVKCSRYVSMHGVALNVGSDLSAFEFIVPCGIADKGVTSISRECGREVSLDDVKMIFSETLVSLLLPRILFQESF